MFIAMEEENSSLTFCQIRNSFLLKLFRVQGRQGGGRGLLPLSDQHGADEEAGWVCEGLGSSRHPEVVERRDGDGGRECEPEL